MIFHHLVLLTGLMVCVTIMVRCMPNFTSSRVAYRSHGGYVNYTERPTIFDIVLENDFFNISNTF